MDTINTLLNEGDPVIAVVGATDNPRKYGNRIYPVNATRATVDGDPVFATLAELPETPDIVNFVVPPTRTLRVLEQAKDLGFTTVWVQPGAENEDVMDYLEEHDFDYLANACIMVRARTRSTI
jgi:predicted CoA-binding protein